MSEILSPLYTALMMFGELFASLLFIEKVEYETFLYIIWWEDLLFSAISKILYFMGAKVLTYFSLNKSKIFTPGEALSLIILPIITCIFFYLFNVLRSQLYYKHNIIFIILSFLFLFSNFIVYIVFGKIIKKNLQIERSKDIEHKKELDYKSYELLKEKYDELRIMIHDFNKYCNNIEIIIRDNPQEAKRYIEDIKEKNKIFELIEYTDNKALNILLYQKIKECNEKNIEFQMCIKNVELYFIKEVDTVSIFANLIDNGIESCCQSLAKKIFFSIYRLNDTFIVIKIENSSDQEPVLENDRLISRKFNKYNHGVGILSVKKTIEKYNGHLEWKYKKDEKIFETILLINDFIV